MTSLSPGNRPIEPILWLKVFFLISGCTTSLWSSGSQTFLHVDPKLKYKFFSRPRGLAPQLLTQGKCVKVSLSNSFFYLITVFITSSRWLFYKKTIRIECTFELLQLRFEQPSQLCLICWKAPFAFLARLTLILVGDFIALVDPSSYSLAPWPFSDPHSTPWLFIDPLDGPIDSLGRYRPLWEPLRQRVWRTFWCFLFKS